MTREEAIKELKKEKAAEEAKIDFEGTPDMLLVNALDMAIEAIQENEKLKHQIKGLRKKVNRHKRLIGELKHELSLYDRSI